MLLGGLLSYFVKEHLDANVIFIEKDSIRMMEFLVDELERHVLAELFLYSYDLYDDSLLDESLN